MYSFNPHCLDQFTIVFHFFGDLHSITKNVLLFYSSFKKQCCITVNTLPICPKNICQKNHLWVIPYIFSFLQPFYSGEGEVKFLNLLVGQDNIGNGMAFK